MVGPHSPPAPPPSQSRRTRILIYVYYKYRRINIALYYRLAARIELLAIRVCVSVSLKQINLAGHAPLPPPCPPLSRFACVAVDWFRFFIM